ncbi:MAG: ComF family protein [Candidatus Obscuribacterales bacterium]|nr:ComF family protein [Candidatus Obscuribacterales bacterium]
MDRLSAAINAALKALAGVTRLICSCLCLENCRICKKELSLTLGFDYQKETPKTLVETPTSKIDRAIAGISQLVCTESTYPALLKAVDAPLLSTEYSECLCYECWLNLEIGEALVGTCKLKNTIQTKLPIVSGAAYEGKVRDLIGRFKYDGDKLLATDLSYIMVNAWSALSERIPASNLLLVPVPLHKHRLRNRGFNQADLLARHLSLVTGVKRVNALSRTIYTRPQQTLGRQERLNNVKGAFKVNARLVQGKNIILVDDVCTSGATLIECTEELLQHGAVSVAAITVARAIIYHNQSDKANDAA